MKMEYSSQGRETFEFLTANLAAVTSRANQQLLLKNEMYFFQAAFVFLTNASVTITRKATETGAVVRAMGIDAVGIEIT